MWWTPYNEREGWPSEKGEYVVWLDYGYWSTAHFDGNGFGMDDVDSHVTHYMIPCSPHEKCQEGGGSNDDASTLSGATDTLTDKAGRNNKVVTLGT